MLYLYGANIPAHKKLRYALTSIYGIGYQTASRICDELGFGEEVYVQDLTEIHMSVYWAKLLNWRRFTKRDTFKCK